MEQIPERTWLVAGAVVVAGPALLFYAVLVFPLRPHGTMYISVSDITRDLRGVTEISMAVEKVELHSPKRGWVSVVSNGASFDLLALRRSGAMQLAGEKKIRTGLYDKVRVTLGPVRVHTYDGLVHEAVLGSRTFVIAANTAVSMDKASHINIDINAGSSLHKAVDGTFVFAPVVVFKSQDGVLVSVAEGGTLVASGGTVNARVAVGTDLSGTTHAGAALAKNTKIVIAGETLYIDSPTERHLAHIGPDGNMVGE